ncbi:MAG: outer membrane beta-barrel protein [Muribaculaceae bacterium]|nr:outer membrane beta-barrel protein [Muribaculaceae bacterium]
MKKLLTAATAALIMAAAPAASAQAGTDAPSTLQKVSVFYDLNTLYPKGADNTYFNGFGVGYSIDFRVADELPLYVGTGLDARFLFNSRTILDDTEFNLINVKAKSTFINFNVPINVSYRVPVADGFYLTPQLGLDFRVQAYGHSSLDADNVSLVSPQLDEIIAETHDGINLFSDKDMGSEKLRRFQMGWHAGVNFEYNRFNLGLSYGTDFVKLHKDLGASHFLVSLGYSF